MIPPFKFLICLIFNFSLGILQLSAQTSSAARAIPEMKVQMEQLTVNDGLSQGMVTCFLKDRMGFLWVGTKDGLNRYDGYEFKVYRNSETDSTSIHDNHIISLFQDKDGKIWIGTMHNGITRFDPGTGTFLRRSVNNRINESLASKSIRSFAQDSEGKIWVCSVAGFDYLTPVPGRVESFTVNHLSNSAAGIPSNIFEVMAWRFLHNGAMELYVRDKIITVSNPDNPKLAKSSFSNLNNYLAFNDDRAYPIFDDKRQIIFYTSQSGITAYDIKKHSIIKSIQVNINPDNFPDPILDKNGIIWVKNVDGLCKYDFETNTLFKVKSGNRSIDDAHFYDYSSAYQDINGVLWFGTLGYGILKYSPGREKFRQISGYNGNLTSISGIYETPQKEIVVQIYQTNDPYVCNLTNGTFEKPYTQLSRFDNNLRNGNSMVFDSANVYLAHESLFRYNIHDKTHQKFLLPENYEFGSGVLYDPLHFDANGRLWCSSGLTSGEKTLFQIDKNTGKILQEFHFPDAQMRHEYRFVSEWLEDNKGNFWFGTLQGVYRFNTASNTWKIFKLSQQKDSLSTKNVVFSINPDPINPDSFLWVGTNGFGLKKLNILTGEVKVYTSENGLPNNVIYGIESDARNNLWLSTNNGLCLFDPYSGAIRNFTESDGLQSLEFNRYAHHKRADGMIFFGGVNGLNFFNPEDFYLPTSTSNTVLTGLKINNQYVGPGDTINRTVLLKMPLEHTDQIKFPPDISMISFSFSYMDLSNPKQNRFRYKLEGFNNTWISSGAHNEATYTNLSPGDYTFLVIGRKGNGLWSTEPSSIHFTILSPWYATLWFRSLAITILVCAVYGFYSYRLANALKIQNIRNSIANDLHDEIGSTLSSISISTTIIEKKLSPQVPEIGKLLDQISTNTNSMMEAMSDIVWAINTRNDRFDNVINRMRAFSIEILEPKNYNIHFNVPEKLLNLQLNMSQRKNLYLIFKESVNNIAKYAECKNVWIDISIKNNKVIMMKVIDDGIGFDANGISGTDKTAALTSYGGNGLYNMHKRAIEINGKLIVKSVMGQGTIINLEFS